jgi:hypothetical protein
MPTMEMLRMLHEVGRSAGDTGCALLFQACPSDVCCCDRTRRTPASLGLAPSDAVISRARAGSQRTGFVRV